MIDITGLDKASVLAALYNRAKPLGLGRLQYTPEDMTLAEATDLLADATPYGTYFDYVHGRVMKVRLDDDAEFEERLYDRDNGPGAAAEVVAALRSGGQQVAS